MVLAQSGVDPATATTLLPARDDVARLGLLLSGSAEAAVISSSLAPARLARAGMTRLCGIGDSVRIPTTGFAVHEAFQARESALVEATVHILRRALTLIHRDPGLVASVLGKYFGVEERDRPETAALLAPYYTEDGRTSETIAQGAIDAMCRSLSISAPPRWQTIYRFQA